MFAFVCTRCEKRTRSANFYCFDIWLSWATGRCRHGDTVECVLLLTVFWSLGVDQGLVVVFTVIIVHAVHSKLWATPSFQQTHEERREHVTPPPRRKKSLSNPSFSTWGSCTWRLQTTQSCRFPVCYTALAVNGIFSCLWAHMKTNNTSFLQTVKVEYYSCFSLCEILEYLWCIYIYICIYIMS